MSFENQYKSSHHNQHSDLCQSHRCDIRVQRKCPALVGQKDRLIDLCAVERAKQRGKRGKKLLSSLNRGKQHRPSLMPWLMGCVILHRSS